MARTHYDLVAEVLDQQLLDFIGRPMGKVDGVVLELREGEAPRVSHLAVGGVTLARRLRAPVGRWLEAAARRWGGSRGEPFRIPWERVKQVGLEVEVELDADRTPALYWEHRLGAWVRRIPLS
jgi:sporulation protein YlmC with PRC-barrel domain